MALSGTGLAEAIVIANKIREAIAGLKFGFRGKPVKITLSAGLTEVNDDDNSQSALNRAEVALYRAKAAGRNCCLAG